MNVDPGYKYIENIRGGVHWCMMKSEDSISNIIFELENQ